MSKSILVLDTPDRCLDCPLGSSEESDGEEVYCNILECATYQKGIYEDEDEEEMYNDKKPDWCPLKAVPKKRDLKDIENHAGTGTDYVWSEGYNACIDEVLGGNEE